MREKERKIEMVNTLSYNKCPFLSPGICQILTFGRKELVDTLSFKPVFDLRFRVLQNPLDQRVLFRELCCFNMNTVSRFPEFI